MTMNELVKAVLEIMPNALFAEGDNGELMIASGFKTGGDPDSDLIEVEA